MKKDKLFWPPRKMDFPAWMENFTDFVDKNAVVLGFTSEEVTWLKDQNAAVSFAQNMIVASKKLWKDFIKIRNVQYVGDSNNQALTFVNWAMMSYTETPPAPIAPNLKVKLAGYVKRVATCNDITREQKRDAGVLSSGRKKVNANDVTPILKVKVVNGQAVLDCTLRPFKGYAVYVEDGNEPAVLITNSTARKYTDIRSIPGGMQTQQRTYFVQYLGNKNTTVGNFSNRVTVAVMQVL